MLALVGGFVGTTGSAAVAQVQRAASDYLCREWMSWLTPLRTFYTFGAIAVLGTIPLQRRHAPMQARNVNEYQRLAEAWCEMHPSTKIAYWFTWALGFIDDPSPAGQAPEPAIPSPDPAGLPSGTP